MPVTEEEKGFLDWAFAQENPAEIKWDLVAKDFPELKLDVLKKDLGVPMARVPFAQQVKQVEGFLTKGREALTRPMQPEEMKTGSKLADEGLAFVANIPRSALAIVNVPFGLREMLWDIIEGRKGAGEAAGELGHGLVQGLENLALTVSPLSSLEQRKQGWEGLRDDPMGPAWTMLMAYGGASVLGKIAPKPGATPWAKSPFRMVRKTEPLSAIVSAEEAAAIVPKRAGVIGRGKVLGEKPTPGKVELLKPIEQVQKRPYERVLDVESAPFEDARIIDVRPEAPFRGQPRMEKIEGWGTNVVRVGTRKQRTYAKTSDGIWREYTTGEPVKPKLSRQLADFTEPKLIEGVPRIGEKRLFPESLPMKEVPKPELPLEAGQHPFGSEPRPPMAEVPKPEAMVKKPAPKGAPEAAAKEPSVEIPRISPAEELSKPAKPGPRVPTRELYENLIVPQLESNIALAKKELVEIKAGRGPRLNLFPRRNQRLAYEKHVRSELQLYEELLREKRAKEPVPGEEALRPPKLSESGSIAHRVAKDEAGYLRIPRKVAELGSQAHKAFDHTIKQTRKVVKTVPGREVVTSIDAIDRAAGTRTGTWGVGAKETGIFKFSEAERLELADALEGATAKTPKVAKTAEKMRTLLDEVASEAQSVGVQVTEWIYNEKGELVRTERPFQPRQNFFPRELKYEVSSDIFADVANAMSKSRKLRAEAEQFGRIDQAALANIYERLAKTEGFSESTLEALAHLQNEGLVKTPGQAIRYLDRHFSEQYTRVAGSLERTRKLEFPAHFYERDAGLVLDRYFRKAARRISEVEQWGPYSEFITNQLKRINEINPAEADFVKGMIARFSQIGSLEPPRWLRDTYDYFTAYEVMTKIGLGTATIPNMTQMFIFTLPKAGALRTAKGAFKLLSPKMRRSVALSGATSYEAMLMLAGYTPGIMHKPIPRVIMSVFNEVNRINKAVSAATADVYIRDLHNIANGKGVIKESWFRGKRARWAQTRLKELGIDSTKPLSERGKLEGIYRFATDTQLQRNVLREPMVFNDPRFRPFVLFKRFGYRQFTGMKDLLVSELKSGNVAPFLRAAAGGAIGGEFVIWAKNQLRSLLSGRPTYREEDTWWKHAINNYCAVGTMGMLTDVAWIDDEDEIARVLGRTMSKVAFALTPVPLSEAQRVSEVAMRTPFQFRTPEGSTTELELPLRRGVRRTALDVVKQTAPLFRYAAQGLETVSDKRARLGYYYKDFYGAIKRGNDEQADRLARELASIGADADGVAQSLRSRGATTGQIIKAAQLMNKYIMEGLPVRQKVFETNIERKIRKEQERLRGTP